MSCLPINTCFPTLVYQRIGQNFCKINEMCGKVCPISYTFPKCMKTIFCLVNPSLSLFLSLPLSISSLFFRLSHFYSASLCKFTCVHTHKRYTLSLCPSPYLSVSVIPLYTHTHTHYTPFPFPNTPHSRQGLFTQHCYLQFLSRVNMVTRSLTHSHTHSPISTSYHSKKDLQKSLR